MIISCSVAQENSFRSLDNYNFNSDANLIIKLPKQLKEISGLAYTAGNYLFAHEDETGVVYKIDVETGSIVKKFEVGKKKLKKDFEGIAVVNDNLFLTTSSGVLYKFSEGEDNEEVEFEKVRTGLKKDNNVEGLCYDSTTNSLLLACKGKPGKGYDGFKAVYSFNVDEMKLKSEPRFLISLDQLKKDYGIKDFSPSGIEMNPRSGNFFIISANPEAIIELSPAGELLSAKELNKDNNKQPEGIAFDDDLRLIISDEGKSKKSKLTIIKPAG